MLRTLPALVAAAFIAVAAPLMIATSAEAAPTASAAADSSGPRHVTIPSDYVYAPHTKTNPRLHDYCSDSPDSFPAPGTNADFRGPCARHDMCIEFHQKARSTCDSDLRERMLAECDWTYSSWYDVRRGPCEDTALVYWAVVRTKTFFS